MEKINSIIKEKVMRRVHAVHTIRLVTRMSLSFVIFTASLYALGREVWLSHILENMPSIADAPAVVSFFLSAFRETHSVVQLTIVLSAAAALWLTKEIVSALHMPQLRIA